MNQMEGSANALPDLINFSLLFPVELLGQLQVQVFERVSGLGQRVGYLPQTPLQRLKDPGIDLFSLGYP
ncbi:MAG: hypothetical protein ACUVXF_00480 [Desulfobaccales bacterium]